MDARSLHPNVSFKEAEKEWQCAQYSLYKEHVKVVYVPSSNTEAGLSLVFETTCNLNEVKINSKKS